MSLSCLFICFELTNDLSSVVVYEDESALLVCNQLDFFSWSTRARARTCAWHRYSLNNSWPRFCAGWVNRTAFDMSWWTQPVGGHVIRVQARICSSCRLKRKERKSTRTDRTAVLTNWLSSVRSSVTADNASCSFNRYFVRPMNKSPLSLSWRCEESYVWW